MKIFLVRGEFVYYDAEGEHGLAVDAEVLAADKEEAVKLAESDEVTAALDLKNLRVVDDVGRVSTNRVRWHAMHPFVQNRLYKKLGMGKGP